jgi:uncharacterized membrane protein YedE/YeeE
MSARVKTGVAGGLIGVVFGVILSWSGMTAPDVIRGALLFQHGYLFLFMASAMGTAAAGLALVRRRERRAVLVDSPITITREQPARRHVVGAVLFGIGWGVADACPGPILTQIGQGIGWAVFTLVGVVAGVYAFQRRSRPETEPAVDPAPRAGVRTSARTAG